MSWDPSLETQLVTGNPNSVCAPGHTVEREQTPGWRRDETDNCGMGKTSGVCYSLCHRVSTGSDTGGSRDNGSTWFTEKAAYWVTIPLHKRFQRESGTSYPCLERASKMGTWGTDKRTTLHTFRPHIIIQLPIDKTSTSALQLKGSPPLNSRTSPWYRI